MREPAGIRNTGAAHGGPPETVASRTTDRRDEPPARPITVRSHHLACDPIQLSRIVREQVFVSTHDPSFEKTAMLRDHALAEDQP
jgi:hypothetical protein